MINNKQITEKKLGVTAYRENDVEFMDISVITTYELTGSLDVKASFTCESVFQIEMSPCSHCFALRLHGWSARRSWWLKPHKVQS